MHVQYFINRDHPNTEINGANRVHRLGIKGDNIFIYVDYPSIYKFYAIDVNFPTNWHLIGSINKEGMSYLFPVLSPDAKYIFVLFLCVNDTGELCFAVDQIETKTKISKIYGLSSAELNLVLEMPFDHLKVKCGDDYQLAMYDRTLVQGEIPFWTVKMDEENMSFTVHKNAIGDVGDERSTLFPIAVDPANRCFAKLMSPRKMLVYTEERKKWVEYVLPPEVSLKEIFGTDGFPIEDSRSIRETYGTHGRRVGAMQTKLTFHDQDGVVIARVLHNDRLHSTALVEFVHDKREIRVRKLATFNVAEHVTKMFYFIGSPDFNVFLGVVQSAVVYIRKPKLEEIAGSKIQQILAKHGYVYELCQVSNHQQLKFLALAKYTEHNDNVKEHLRQLGIEEPEKRTFHDFELD